MGDVHYVEKWAAKPDTSEIRRKMTSLDQFIRSRIVPPPIGSVVFTFRGGKVSLTGSVTHITGGDCEVIIQRDNVILSGCCSYAEEMFCSIHREIEEIRSADSAA